MNYDISSVEICFERAGYESLSRHVYVPFRDISNAFLSVGLYYPNLHELIGALEKEGLKIIISDDNRIVNGTKFEGFLSTRIVLFEKFKNHEYEHLYI